MLINLNHLHQLTLVYEPGQSVAIDPDEEIRRFLRDRELSAVPVHRASLILTDRLSSDATIFQDMSLPASGHGDYPGWAKLAGHSFDTAITISSFDRITRRLVEVASASGHGRGSIRLSSNDLKTLFSNWMDTTI